MTIAIFGIFIILAMGAGLYVSGKVPGTGNWVLGGLTALLGVIALFVAARAGSHSPVGMYGGIGLFVLSLLFVLFLLKRAYDEAEGHKH